MNLKIEFKMARICKMMITGGAGQTEEKPGLQPVEPRKISSKDFRTDHNFCRFGIKKKLCSTLLQAAPCTVRAIKIGK